MADLRQKKENPVMLKDNLVMLRDLRNGINVMISNGEIQASSIHSGVLELA